MIKESETVYNQTYKKRGDGYGNIHLIEDRRVGGWRYRKGVGPDEPSTRGMVIRFGDEWIRA